MTTTIADSLHRLVAIKDSLLELVATRAVTVNVPPQDVTVSVPTDWVQVAITVGSGIAAAILGAWVGGVQARKGGLEAIRKEFRLNRRYAVERLRRRIDRNLIRTMTVSMAVAKHDPSKPFTTDTDSELQMIWESFERLSEHLSFLGQRILQDRVDILFAKVRKAADRIRELEGREWELVMATEKDPETMSASILRNEVEGERRRIIAEVAPLELEAKRLWIQVYDLAAQEGAKSADIALRAELEAADAPPEPAEARGERPPL